ncbi:DUF4185 domain-containing protein [Flindersiella endophytica]
MEMSKLSRRAVLGGAAGLAGMAGLSARAGFGSRTASAAAYPTVVSATPNAALTNTFTQYANTGGGWTGADGSYSAKLPDGRQLWVYSDTFLGEVTSDGGRPQTSPFINNSFIVQQGSRLSTVHGGTAADPRAVIAPETPDAWYWAGATKVSGNLLQIVYLEMIRTGTGMWDWRWNRNVVARFDATTLRLLGTAPVPSSANIQWGMWLEKVGTYTYVYGVEDLQNDKYLHVARVRGDDLRGTWSYWTGSGWSAVEAESARVLLGIGNEFSVTRYGDWYLLVTQDTTEIFSAKLTAYFGTSPVGPFGGKTLLYTTPETGPLGSYGNPNIISYSMHEHPELRRGDRLLVTYCVNSLDSNDLYADASIYRPRYIDVVLSG